MTLKHTPIFSPFNGLGLGFSGRSNQALGSGDQIAGIFMTADAFTLEKVHINASSVSVSGDYTVRIETVTTGKHPSGTLYVAGATETITVSTTGQNTATFSTPVVISAGDVYAVVVTQTGSASASFTYSWNPYDAGANSVASRKNISGAGWAIFSSKQGSTFAIEDVNGRFAMGGAGVTSSNAISYADENSYPDFGVTWKQPFDAVFAGFNGFMEINTNSSVVAYLFAGDSDISETTSNALSSATFNDWERIDTSSDSPMQFLFDGESRLRRDQWYQLRIKMTTNATMKVMEHTIQSAAIRIGVFGERYATRWSNTTGIDHMTTKVHSLNPLVSMIDDGNTCTFSNF